MEESLYKQKNNKKMIRGIKILMAALLMVWISLPTMGQDKRTEETKVADILAQFPAESMQQTDKLMGEITGMGEEGILRFCRLIVSPGTGNDVQARYALSSLARYAGAPGHEGVKVEVENAFLKSLEFSSDREIKAFFIRKLGVFGGDATVMAMKKYLETKDLYSPALFALTFAGTEKAKSIILSSLPAKSTDQQVETIKDLGKLEYLPAESVLISMAKDPVTNQEVRKQIYSSLAKLGMKESETTLKTAAKKAGYSSDKTEAMNAYLEYARKLGEKGEKKLSKSICKNVLKKCNNTDQLVYRSAALEIYSQLEKEECVKLLIREFTGSEDKAYRNAVLCISGENMTDENIESWCGIFRQISAERQQELLDFLSFYSGEEIVKKVIEPGLSSADENVRAEAIRVLAFHEKEKAVPELIKQLKNVDGEKEYKALENALINVCSEKDGKMLAGSLNSLNEKGQTIIVKVLCEKRCVKQGEVVFDYCNSSVAELRNESYLGLSRVVDSQDLEKLIVLLEETEDLKETELVGKAIIFLYTNETPPSDVSFLKAMNVSNSKEKYIPVLPYLKDKNTISQVLHLFKEGNTKEKSASFKALTKWRDISVLPILYDIFSDKDLNEFHKEAFNAFIRESGSGNISDDEQLLWLKKIMTECQSIAEKKEVIKAAGEVKTFLSLVFVSSFFEEEELESTVAGAVMNIVLPSVGKNNGMTGKIARKSLIKAKKHVGSYAQIDIQEYLDKMIEEEGYVAIFNGKNLDGWQGLVKNPVERLKMTKEELAKEQVKADNRVSENWSVKDGCILFNGNGNNLCTKKIYGDFEMIVDWKITKKGDSGIYLRGTPQVQIWDTSRIEVGAQVGSGGLYNNKINKSTPIVVADNPVNEWNTFRIKMKGDVVTVYLNGILVVDHVTMENYWDRNIPIFPKGPIELQSHGTNLLFRNIYVKEISEEKGISKKEKTEGFVSLFNGKNLNGWVGNKIDYSAENGMLTVHPKEGNHGNLYTEKEYSNFDFRFDFQLTKGANNGVGIHAPLKGDAAYVGKEIQILDNNAPIYAHLKKYQYHGSVYGIIPSKRGYLKPVGEWNSEEILVKGDYFKVILNGEVILNGNVKESSKNGTLDHKNHPGLKRHNGHIGFLGHGSELKFKNIRIKEL